MGSNSDPERFHSLRATKACAQALRPSHLEPVVRERSQHSEKPAHRNEAEPLVAPQLEKPAHSNKASAKPKIKQLINCLK